MISDTNPYGKYIVVSPAKDEYWYLETTVQAVLKQTILPAGWIIVDDGSRDRTPHAA